MNSDTTAEQIPRGAESFRFSPTTTVRLRRLAALLNTNKTSAVEQAIAHTLATIEKGQPLHPVPPSEREEREK